MVPLKIKIGAFEYRIKWEDNPMHDNVNCLGVCTPDDKIITLSNKIKEDQQVLFSVLLHELIHAIDDTYDIGLSEKKVNQIGMGVHDLFVNNDCLFDMVKRGDNVKLRRSGQCKTFASKSKKRNRKK